VAELINFIFGEHIFVSDSRLTRNLHPELLFHGSLFNLWLVSSYHFSDQLIDHQIGEVPTEGGRRDRVNHGKALEKLITL